MRFSYAPPIGTGGMQTKFYAIRRDDPAYWARRLIGRARQRERKAGVRKAKRLSYAYTPVIIQELLEGPWSDKFVRGDGTTAKWSPTLSRLDHNKPYSGNFVIEPLTVNLARASVGGLKDKGRERLRNEGVLDKVSFAPLSLPI